MKMKNSELFELQTGLQALDGQVVDGKLQRFRFSGTTLYAIAKNLRRVKEACAALDETRKKLQAQYGFDADPNAIAQTDGYEKPKIADFRALNAEWDKVMAQEIDLVLTQIKLSELRLPPENIDPEQPSEMSKYNFISASTLARIDFIISDGK